MSHIGTHVGIIGGGQLGLMMIQAATTLGISTTVLDPSPGSCSCSNYSPSVVEGSLIDEDAIEQIFIANGRAKPDVITIEIEHVNATALAKFSAKYGIPVYPSPSAISMIQDKYIQKQWLQSHGFPVASFCTLSEKIALSYETLNFPFFVKSRKNAYDGHGTTRIASIEQFMEYLKNLQADVIDRFYVEECVAFDKELSSMIALSTNGEMIAFPLVQTSQANHICDFVVAPAQLDNMISSAATSLCKSVLEKMDAGAGVFAFELFFVKETRQLLLNEIAPRPHNSGHWSMDACTTSQFEQHLLAICGGHLRPTTLTHPSALMINILGRESESMSDLRKRLDKWTRRCPNGKLHWYCKKEVRKGRKMGHFTLISDTVSHLFKDASQILRDKDTGPISVDEHVVDTTPISHLFSCSDNIPVSGDSQLLPYEGCLAMFPHNPSNFSAFPLVGIIMGSDSDLPTMKNAASTLYRFGVPYEVTIVSAHRTPERLLQYGKTATERGLKVIIAGAGGAAHLPGMIASLTTLPVVGVPVIPLGHGTGSSAAQSFRPVPSLNGLDALLSIVQMPAGIPVATVAIGNATNAALLAVRILSTGSANSILSKALSEYSCQMAHSVEERAASLADHLAL